MSIGSFPYFGWSPEGFEEEEKEEMRSKEPCDAVGCIKGSVLLLYSRIQCHECGGTGITAKDDDK